MQLVKYDAACRALAEAKRVDEVKKIRDVSEAARLYARQAKNKSLEIDASEIRMRAEIRLGEMIRAQKELPKERGGGLNQGAVKVPGWICKPLRADYIAYAIAPAGRCYLLPVIQLQQAFEKYGKDWCSKREPIIARNKDRHSGREWETESVAVSIDALYPAIGRELRVSFLPYTGPVNE